MGSKEVEKQARILITGDFCPINRIRDLVNEREYDTIFNNLLPIIKESNLAITNLECPLTESEQTINKTGPLLKSSPNAAKALAFAGFNLVTLANNHIMDYGSEGLASTAEVCEKHSIAIVGAGKDNVSAREILYRIVGNQMVAVLNFSENEFSTTAGDFPGSNPLSLIDNFNDIRMARAKADHVLVIVHGGHEMYNLPSPRIKNTFRFFADAGASIVIGHHSHCYSGYEVYNGIPIFYSLGNFIFDYPGRRTSGWNTGFAIELSLKGKLEFSIIPYEQCADIPGVHLMTTDAKLKFDDDIERLNRIISDDNLLRTEFDNYCKTVKRMYLSYLEPHSIMLLHYLRNRKLFPSILSKKKKMLYLNLIRCESHRDVVSNILDHRNFLKGNSKPEFYIENFQP